LEELPIFVTQNLPAYQQKFLYPPLKIASQKNTVLHSSVTVKFKTLATSHLNFHFEKLLRLFSLVLVNYIAIGQEAYAVVNITELSYTGKQKFDGYMARKSFAFMVTDYKETPSKEILNTNS